LSAIALTAVAAWLLITKQRSVMQVLGLCAGVGLVMGWMQWATR
jgi:hypothetical protein